jgi:hypothetical protein
MVALLIIDKCMQLKAELLRLNEAHVVTQLRYCKNIHIVKHHHIIITLSCYHPLLIKKDPGRS